MRLGRVLVLVLLACVLALGCAGPVRERARALDHTIARARERGAYRCAPRELAMAVAHVAFARAELAAGEWVRARGELAIAEVEGARALQLTAERCGAAPRPKPATRRKPLDTDGDGVPDPDDRCPAEPEDRDGFEDEDGCPDPDNDGDGILDKDDRCPAEPEDLDRVQDEDGCPDPDNDGDGLSDAEDRCPNEPGPKASGGCPETDRDGDGVVDRLDRCPDVAGVAEPGRPAGSDGCPAPRFITLTKEKIELRQKVYFVTNSAKIMRESFAMLTEIAELLSRRPEIRVRIEGHTDSRGGAAKNQRLSQARAESVRRFLVEHGVVAARLEARGFGPTQPIADNRTEKGRDANRRVEFIIASQ